MPCRNTSFTPLVAGGLQQPAAQRLQVTKGDSMRTRDLKSIVGAIVVGCTVLAVTFAGTSAFGGVIPTPHFDRLAKGGLRYNQFHTTALCSPTRQALKTGRNHHSANGGTVMEVSTAVPGLQWRGPD